MALKTRNKCIDSQTGAFCDMECDSGKNCRIWEETPPRELTVEISERELERFQAIAGEAKQLLREFPPTIESLTRLRSAFLMNRDYSSRDRTAKDYSDKF